METTRPPAKTCKMCEHYPDNCGYWALDGKADRNGNIERLNLGLLHNCRDWHPTST